MPLSRKNKRKLRVKHIRKITKLVREGKLSDRSTTWLKLLAKRNGRNLESENQKLKKAFNL